MVINEFCKTHLWGTIFASINVYRNDYSPIISYGRTNHWTGVISMYTLADTSSDMHKPLLSPF